MRAMVIVLLPMLLGAPAASAQESEAAPLGAESDPIGSLQWLPDNANEVPNVSPGTHRLTFVYDHSLDEDGTEMPLLAKGPFEMRLFTTAVTDIRMKAHSDSVSSLDGATGREELAAVDEVFAGVAGDVRDGECSKLGTPDFSSAYSTTREFVHPGEDPYPPAAGAGFCERVDDSAAVVDEEGRHVGFRTTVTTFRPGFWLDLEWPEREVAIVGTNAEGRLLPELWYGALFDTDGEDAEWYEAADDAGSSTSVWSPGQYDQVLSFSATPGASGDPCRFQGSSTTGTDAVPGSWAAARIQVPEGSTKAIFRLFPKGDWNLTVSSPSGERGLSVGSIAGFDETVVVPGEGPNDIGTLEPGEYTMLACNLAGEQVVTGAVRISRDQ